MVYTRYDRALAQRRNPQSSENEKIEAELVIIAHNLNELSDHRHVSEKLYALSERVAALPAMYRPKLHLRAPRGETSMDLIQSPTTAETQTGAHCPDAPSATRSAI
jgi:hypothetical protein